MSPMLLFSFQSFLESGSDDVLSPLDKLLGGGMMVLIGMATVFAVLVTIWLALICFKIAFHDLPAKRKAKVSAVAIPQETVVASVATNDDEIVAAIAAAIAMAESESDGVKFRVVSFRRR